MNLPVISDLTSDLVISLIPEPVIPDPNIKVLLDAQVPSSMKTTGGGGVFRWEDQSGFGNDAVQSIVASQPTESTAFGKPGILIDNTDDYMIIPFTHDWNNQAFTIIAVASFTSGFNKGLIGNRFGAGAAQWWTLGHQSFMVVEKTGGVTTLSFAFNASGQPIQIYEFAHNPGVNDRIFRNGVLADTESTAINIGGTSNELRIGRWVSAIQGWNGQINQIEVRTELFDAAKRASIVAALNTKWQ